MVSRNEFMTIYASRYGRELHGRKPIINFIAEHSIEVDITMPLKKLSALITSQSKNEKQNMFVISDQNIYRGVGNVMDLLRQITDLQITTARHANPLTGLPGNVPINTCIQKAIEEQRDIVVCYLDLDNFKPYNDAYSFEKGDKVLYETAKVLVEEAETENDFVGHVGGDDFIIIFESDDWLTKCQRIHKRFNQLLSMFYTQIDLERQGIESIDRHGDQRFFQLLSISIGAVRLLDFTDVKSEVDLAFYATKAKSIAKKTNGNSIYRLRPEACLDVKQA